MTYFTSFFVLILSLFVGNAYAEVAPPPELAVKAYLLKDFNSNRVLAEQQSQNRVEPASLTKLMTAYVVFDALKSKKIDLKQTFSVSTTAWKMPGSRMFIDPKMSVPVEDLIKGMIVQSGNDATVALAEGVGGSVDRFVQLMNEQAKRLGMNATVYKNPEGLTTPGHITTANDLSILATRLMHDFPEYVGYYAIKKYRYPGTPAANDSNRNLLLFRDPTVDGLKTGHTDAAGFCMIATAKRDVPGFNGRRLLSIVLGASSENARAVESQKLLNWGFTSFETLNLFNANQAVFKLKVWKGKDNELSIGKTEPIVIAVPTGQSSLVSSQIEYRDPLVAPVQKGEVVAKMKLKLGKENFSSIDLEALQPIEQASIFGRAWDALRLWIK